MNPYTNQPYTENYFKEQLKICSAPANNPKILAELEILYKKNQVIIVKAETGAGKGVIIAPQIMMFENPDQKINRVVITEPRTVNTHTAEYICKVLDAPIVDFSYRFNNKLKESTRLAFVTDGFLVEMLFGNGELPKAIIIDEVHERNKNIDILLTFLKKEFKGKIILLSATFDPKFFEKYFKGFDVGILEISGRSYPVEEHFVELGNSDYISKSIEILTTLPQGDVLIFMPSAGDLRKACREVSKKIPNSVCYELHRGTPDLVKEEIKSKNNKRKVIFSTNIAESGITIDGIKFVIDTGLRNENKFDAEEEMYCLDQKFISVAEAEQRKGRAGRTAPGVCYHLYSEKDYKNFPAEKDPEIVSEEITDVILKLLKKYDLKKVIEFLGEMPNPPSKKQIDFSIANLEELECIEKGQLTNLGLEVLKIPLNVRDAIVLIEAKKLNCEYDVCKIMAMISINSRITDWFVNVNPEDKDYKNYLSSIGKWHSARGEVYLMRKILNEYLDKDQEWAKKNYLKSADLEKAKKQYFKLKENVRNKLGGSDNEDNIEKAISKGYSKNIAVCLDGNDYKINYPVGKIIIKPDKFITKVSKKVLFMEIKKINGTVRVSGLLNL